MTTKPNGEESPENLEELKNIKKNWYLDDLIEYPSKLEHVLETILSVVLSQQEQIEKLIEEKLNRDYRELDG
jgi:transcription termination factor NusB